MKERIQNKNISKGDQTNEQKSNVRSSPDGLELMEHIHREDQ